MKKTLGLPLVCGHCPARHYYGVLWAETVPTELVKLNRKSAVCPNCRRPLVPADR